VGKEIAQMLYAHNAKVYMAARSETKTRKAIESIIAAVPKSSGQLCVLSLDLADLNLVKEAAEAFKKQEHQLHLLFNNAGVGYPDPGSKTAQGYELQLGVNCVGPFLFTKLLAPTLIYTAKNSPSNSVRVIWTSSSATEGISANGFMDNLDYHIEKSGFHKYCMSKIGNYLHSTEFAARYKQHGIISVSLNPGHLDSDFWRTQSPLVLWLLRRTVLYPTVFGAYTSVFAAFSPKISLENSGTFSMYPLVRFTLGAVC
jgi:NAD(P)-dependent dehydrogenase (short-subunit alcohol dehydrogenase family)